MKKILAFALVLAMTMALSLSVCAVSPIEAENGTDSKVITITNSISGDGTKVYYVDVEWTTNFVISTVGKWDPESHTYTDDSSNAVSSVSGEGAVVVTNHSNTPVTASLSFTNVNDSLNITAGDPITLADASLVSYGVPSSAPNGGIAINVAVKDDTVITETEVSFTATVTIS